MVNNAGVNGLEYAQDHVGVSEEKLSGMDMNQQIELVLGCSRETCDAGKKCLRTNYYGAKQVTEALLPLLQASEVGRIVRVRQLRQRAAEARAERLEEPHRGEAGRGGRHVREGHGGRRAAGPWVSAAHKVSKAALSAYSRMLARRHPELRVNCVHPGYVRTDMTIHSAFVTPEEGGSRVVAVALLPAGGPIGAFFMDRQQAPFV